jgi:signal transduction histidine kinase
MGSWDQHPDAEEAAFILRIREDERARIAREIHDDSLQALAELRLRVESLVGSFDDPVRTLQVSDLVLSFGRAVARLRMLAFHLDPRIADVADLAAAVHRALLDVAALAGVEPHLDDRLRGVELAPDALMVVFRIVNESLINVRRHAAARHVVVAMEPADDGVRVTIEDDGCGFDPSLSEGRDPGHLGLRSMRERARLAGGSCQVRSTRGLGTTVELWMPSAG